MFVYFFGKMNPVKFFKAILPAQLLGFSTSSSAATLPATMECAEENLHIRKDVLNFFAHRSHDQHGRYLSVSGCRRHLYCAGHGIRPYHRATAKCHSNGNVGLYRCRGRAGSRYPDAGNRTGIHRSQSSRIALIFAVDRPLDMLRTATNVSGDSMVALLMNRFSTAKDNPPQIGNK